MFKNSGLRGKLVLLLSVPLVALLLFAGNNLREQVVLLSEANTMLDLAKLAEHSSAVMHELQAERGMSSNYLGSAGVDFKDALPGKRKATDAELAAYRAFLVELNLARFDAKFAAEVEDATKALNGLEDMRAQVTRLAVSAGEAVAFYSTLNAELLHTISFIGLQTNNADLSAQITAYHDLLSAKEFAGQERAVLAAVFGSGEMSVARLRQISELDTLQRERLETFTNLATPSQLALYETRAREPYNAEVQSMRQLVLLKAEKDAILQEIEQEVGYGGLVHQFKNYVLRGDIKFNTRVRERYEATVKLMDRYLALPSVNATERAHLASIRSVIGQYNSALEAVAEHVKAGWTAERIDGSVKIDDAPALEAISALAKGNLGVKTSHWFEQSTLRINMLRELDDVLVNDVDGVASGVRTDALIMFTIVAVVALIALTLTVLFGFFITRNLTRSINTVIGDLDSASDQTLSASKQVAASSGALASGASEQAASLEEISSTVEELNAMTKSNAENASKVETLSVDAGKSANTGVEAMERMVVAINQIKASSDETAKIIKTIDEIAFQTNLLALNAAVEAARAGDAGRGFAVVAEEVRNLAKRSADAARSTSQLIEESQGRAVAGVRVGEEVRGSLSEINTAIENVNGLIGDVSQASAEQARGLDQLNAALNQMDSVTQSNASSAEENSASSEELTSQATMLTQIVERLAGLIYGTSGRATANGGGRAEHEATAQDVFAHQGKARPGGLARAVATQAGSARQTMLPHGYEELNDDDFRSM